MKKNIYKRGVTIVEILLSILIIGMVVIVLFNMLVNVRNEDRNNQIQSRYVLNQAQFTERIQEDLIDYGIYQISACDIYQVDVESYNLNDMYRSDFKCLRFDFADDGVTDNVGFLMIYNYNQKYDVNNKGITGKNSSWMIRYVRGHYDYSGDAPTWITLNSLMNEIPDEVQLGQITVKYTVGLGAKTSSSIPNIMRINVPIISEGGEHYDIDLSYSTAAHSDSFISCVSGENTGAAYASIKCECTGNDRACQQSKISRVGYGYEASSTKR